MLPPEKVTRLKHAVQAAETAGLCLVPPRQDGSKQPDVPTWTAYQRRRATPEELTAWYGAGRRTGLGLICGAISGQLELFEFDDRQIYERFLTEAIEVGLGPLVARIRDDYEEVTPGDGVHWFYFVLSGGTKTVALAQRVGLDKNGHPCAFPLIETKGEGGYAVVAPSFGRVHPSGKDYVLMSGGFSSITTITPEERDALWSLARTFDEMPETPPRDDQPKADGKWELRPGDDFNARAEWNDLLTDAGWERIKAVGELTYWRRPGGYAGGWGASTNHGGHDQLHVFTTAAPPLKAATNYSKFGFHAALHHQGNFAEAAASLEAQGYGKRRPQQETGSSSSPGSSSSGPSEPPPPLAPVMPFPVDALPPVTRTFVVAGARALGCPPDFIALPLFAFIGAVAGNSRKLALKPTYVLEPIFWTGVVGKPGAAKSPALGLARRLIDALQKESWSIYQELHDAWAEEKPRERGPEPRLENYFASDTTIEAVAHALQVSRGIAIIHDELVGWVLGFDAYKKSGGDRQAWLSSWSASPLKPNRKSSAPIYVPEPVVCVTGGIQPAVLAQLAGEAARDDGFVPRLLLAWPDAEPSPWTTAVLSEADFAAMLTVVKTLRLPEGQTVVTSLSAAASEEWIAWYDENQAIAGRATGLTAGWAAKAPVHLGRIALVLHLLTYANDHHRQLSVETLRDAIQIVEYVRDHLRRVLPIFGANPPVAGAGLPSRILRLLTNAMPDWLTRTAINDGLGGHTPASAITAALERLERDGAAERQFAETGGRAREEWRAISANPDNDARKKTEEDGKSPPPEPDPPLVPSFSVFPQRAFENAAPLDDDREIWEEPL